MSNEKYNSSVSIDGEKVGQVETIEVDFGSQVHDVKMGEHTHPIATKTPTKMRSRLAMNRLQNIAGVGRSKAEALYDEGYRSIYDVKKASQDELNEIPEIGNALAARIKADVGDHPSFSIDAEEIVDELEQAHSDFENSDDIEETKFLEEGTLMYGME